MKNGVILIFLCILILPSTSTFAAERFTLGPWDVQPYITTEMTYNDNIFQRENDVDGETYFTTTPGVRLDLPWDEHAVTLDYKLKVVHFLEMWNEDQQQNDIYLLYNFEFNKFSFRFSDRFYEDYGVPTGSTRQDIDPYYANVANVNFGMEFNRLIFDIGYTNTIYEYQQIDSGSSRQEDELRITGYVKPFPKTKILFETNLTRRKHDNKDDGNADALELYIGADGKIAPKTTGIIKLGYQWWDYTESGNFKGDGVYVDLNHRFNDYNWLDIEIERKEDANLYAEESYYTISKVLLRYSRKLSWRLTGSLGGYYELDEYPTKGSITREDTVYNANLGFNYQFWEDLRFNAGYDFTKKISNATDADYTSNKVTWKYDLLF